MKKLLPFIFVIFSFFVFPVSSVFAIGSFDASNVTITSDEISFDFANASGSDNIANAFGVACDLTSLPGLNPGAVSLTQTGNHIVANSDPYDGSPHTNCKILLYTNNSENDYISNQTFTIPVPASPSSEVKVIADPASGTKTVGTPFNVDVKVTDEGDAFNAARANVAVSSNLEVTNVFPATSNACNLHYTTNPTTSNPSFAGAIFGGSATDCTVYRLVLTPTSAGTGTVTFNNGSIKSYEDNSEILTGVQNASFMINAAGDTPTPTTGLSQITITSPLQTYLTNFNLAGTKDASITQVFVNDSDDDTTYPSGTTWSVPVTLNLGINNYTIFGRDAEANQTGTITTTVDRHILGDINGDGEIDLLDASLFAVDWDKTEDLSYLLSDMNADGNVDLTDLSILAKLE